MKIKNLLIAVVSVLSVARAETTITPNRIAFYEVPLVCAAAPEIGCGSRSKPILVQLERETPVAEAWLNRPGTLIAIVWKPDAKRKERNAVFKTISEKEQLKVRELSGAARKKALKEFAARDRWHRSSDVDRLSEEEAGIIAARLLGRIQAKVSVSDEKAKAIRNEFTEIFKRRFTSEEQPSPSDTEAQLISVLESHLDKQDVALLKETLPRTLAPLPGEN